MHIIHTYFRAVAMDFSIPNSFPISSSSMASAPKCTARPWLLKWPFGRWKSYRYPQFHRTSVAKTDTTSGFLKVPDSLRYFLSFLLDPAITCPGFRCGNPPGTRNPSHIGLNQCVALGMLGCCFSHSQSRLSIDRIG